MKSAFSALALTGLVLGGAYASLRTGAGSGGTAASRAVGRVAGHAGKGTPLKAAPGHELAAFAMGCFWGSEYLFRNVKGVTATSVGYSGGHTKNPTYEQVCTHTTGHAETVLVEYDPKRVTYGQLLNVFWENHDSTQVDGQGVDHGDSYRSEVFTLSDAQQSQALSSRTAFGKKLREKISTTVEPLAPFWLAEGYHQQYHEKTGTANCPFPKPPKKRGA